MKKIVVLTGAGISAESGLKTFRDSGGLWESYDIMDVATPEAWEKNQELVLEFYNQRRKQAMDAQPNIAHESLVKLEERYQVQIITQNVDDLHERAGSTNVLHLHGELSKARSTVDESLIYDVDDWELNPGDTCQKGSQLRPHIVWFGEMVPMMEVAADFTSEADILLVIGTSLVVYPAAGLVDYASTDSPKYLVDPGDTEIRGIHNLEIVKENATSGVPKVIKQLMER